MMDQKVIDAIARYNRGRYTELAILPNTQEFALIDEEDTANNNIPIGTLLIVEGFMHIYKADAFKGCWRHIKRKDIPKPVLLICALHGISFIND